MLRGREFAKVLFMDFLPLKPGRLYCIPVVTLRAISSWYMYEYVQYEYSSDWIWLCLLYDLGLDPDDAHHLNLAVGVVVEPGAATVHLVRTSAHTHNCLNIEVGTHVFSPYHIFAE